MKHRKLGAALALLGLLTFCAACIAAETPPNETVHDQQNFDEIAKGHYLAILGDCSGCHTAPGGQPFAGGDVVETPFGNVVSANITPDPATGIGNWTDEQFVKALREGQSPGGVHLYPAMPYPYYTKISRQDALAIRAYLETVAPVHHDVTSNQLPFPFDIRFGMNVWNAFFFRSGRFRLVAGKSKEWNRGAYIVEGLGHCGACHTPKNFLGGDKGGDAYQGGVIQGWYSPDLTEDRHAGLADWSAQNITDFLRTGHNRFSAASGPMAKVIKDSTSQMTDGDLKAIATFLKTLPASHTPPKPVAANAPAMRTGQAIYVDNCSACHAENGTGVPNLMPPLKDNPIVQSRDPTALIRVVLNGTANVATPLAPTGAAMPALYWKLSNRQTAAVLTYIRNSWGNSAAAVRAGQVRHLR